LSEGGDGVEVTSGGFKAVEDRALEETTDGTAVDIADAQEMSAVVDGGEEGTKVSSEGED
jgi:hypothetical protein